MLVVSRLCVKFNSVTPPRAVTTSCAWGATACHCETAPPSPTSIILLRSAFFTHSKSNGHRSHRMYFRPPRLSRAAVVPCTCNSPTIGRSCSHIRYFDVMRLTAHIMLARLSGLTAVTPSLPLSHRAATIRCDMRSTLIRAWYPVLIPICEHSGPRLN